MNDPAKVHLVDQISAAIKEGFRARGLVVECSIAVEGEGGLMFEIRPNGFMPTNELMDEVINEAIVRIGGARSV